MGKDKVEKKEKRAEKKEKRAEKDGVHKAGKKEKKDKKDKATLVDAVEKEIASQVQEDLEKAASVVDDAMVIDGERPIGALVPFANPLVEDKQAKKVLKSVKKGKSCKQHHNCTFYRVILWRYLD
jgi:H/ACA ribonucleoprotein complex subunit 2